MNPACWNWSRYQVSPEADNSDFLIQIVQKRVFPAENERSEHDH